jgi:hypothetical protein
MLKQLVYKKIPSDTTPSGEKIKAEKSFWSGLIKAKDNLLHLVQRKVESGSKPGLGRTNRLMTSHESNE